MIGDTTIPGDNIVIVSDTEITGEFYLIDVNTGLYDVQIRNRNFDPEILCTIPSGFTITAPSAPVIESINPSLGENKGTVLFEISGTDLSSVTRVRLSRPGSADIIASGVSATDTTITGTFDLNGKDTGYWDVIISGPNDDLQTLSSGFLILLHAVSNLVILSITRESSAETSVNRVISEVNGTQTEANFGITPYVEKYITSGTASDYLATCTYARDTFSITVAGASIKAFDIIDLSPWWDLIEIPERKSYFLVTSVKTSLTSTGLQQDLTVIDTRISDIKQVTKIARQYTQTDAIIDAIASEYTPVTHAVVVSVSGNNATARLPNGKVISGYWIEFCIPEPLGNTDGCISDADITCISVTKKRINRRKVSSGFMIN